MLVLASYPRSGNTFLRNVLFEVYGISSSTYHHEDHGPDPDWQSAKVVKTHLLPEQLPVELANRKVVYLVRDGRDATVSLGYHKKSLHEPDSLLEENITEAIYAAEGSYFSGWSRHVESWFCKADLVLRFEDLIRDPLGCVEQLRSLIDMPSPRKERIPTFENLKEGSPEYGSGKHIGKSLSNIWFRKGKVGAWKEEMTAAQQRLFWHLHGEVMESVGYWRDGSHKVPERPQFSKPTELLLEGNKLVDLHTDGIKRYVEGLLRAMKAFPIENFRVSVWVNGEVLSIEDALQLKPGYQKFEGLGWHVLKRLAKGLLPDSWYQALAREMPLVRVRSWFSSTGFSSDQRVTKEWDAVWLPLPQHYFLVDELAAKRVLATIHDMTHKSQAALHEANNVERTERGMKWLQEENALLIAVSDATAKAMQKEGLSAEVSYEGVDRRRFYPIVNQHLLDLVRRRYQLPSQAFILSVSTLEPRKNIPRLVEAYKRFYNKADEDIHLVLAGRKGWKWTSIDLDDDLKDHVHITGFVLEEHLPALYTLAEGFAYVSLEEGFGLPVLEALACGTPVVVANNSSLTEVAGEVGFNCDPVQVDSIANGLMGVIKERGDELSERCMEQSWSFTWRETLDRSLALLTKETTDRST